MSLVVVNFTSCKGDDPEEPSGAVTQIKAENVSGDNTRDVATVKFRGWDTDKKAYDVIVEVPFANNGFTLNLPANPAAKFLVPVWNDVPEGLTVSNNTTKGVSVERVDAFDKAGNAIGYFLLANIDNAPQKYYDIHWAYVDKDISITGKVTTSRTTEYNMILKTGWNLVYYVLDGANDTRLFTTQKPSGVEFKWYYQDL